MKQIRFYIFFILLSVNISAQESSNFVASASLVSMSMDYKEYGVNGELLDSEESSFLDLGGVEMSLSYILSGDSEVKVDFMALAGETKYTGSYLDSGLPYGSVISTTQNTIIDIGVSYKRSSSFKNNVLFSYGIGVAYREWERSLSVSQVEVYSWYSIRPMIGVSSDITDKFNIALLIEYQYGFETKMSESSLNHTFTLGGADILEIAVPINYKYNKDLDFFFEVSFQQQTITESDRLSTGNVDEYWYEPESKAYNSYLKFGAAYSF